MALADDKKTAIDQLYVTAKARMELLTAPYSTFEQVAWSIKLDEAQAIVSNAGHKGVLLDEAIATLTFLGVENPSQQQIETQLLEMATAIVSASEQLMKAESVLVGWRSALKRRIEQAASESELAAIDLRAPI